MLIDSGKEPGRKTGDRGKGIVAGRWKRIIIRKQPLQSGIDEGRQPISTGDRMAGNSSEKLKIQTIIKI
ncbi:MAG: hypothetical protein ACOX0F_11885 [Syntrophomonadaceae bacterium]|jgi:hypothetical protein